jgi:hypothetical protein
MFLPDAVLEIKKAEMTCIALKLSFMLILHLLNQLPLFLRMFLVMFSPSALPRLLF